MPSAASVAISIAETVRAACVRARSLLRSMAS